MSESLAGWRAPWSVHDPGKIITDQAAAVGRAGRGLPADIAVLRGQPGLAGPVAPDPVISRLVTDLAADGPRALKAIRVVRAAARERTWALAGHLVTVDLDMTIVIAHSEKDQARPTWKKTFGFHLMTPRPTTARTAPGSHWRSWCDRGMRIQHGRRPHRGDAARAGAAAPPPAAEGSDPR